MYEAYSFRSDEANNKPEWFDTKEYWGRFLYDDLMETLEFDGRRLLVFQSLLAFCGKYGRGPTAGELEVEEFHRMLESGSTAASAHVHCKGLHTQLHTLVRKDKIAHRGVDCVICPHTKYKCYQWFPGNVPFEEKAGSEYDKYTVKQMRSEVIRVTSIAKQIRDMMTKHINGAIVFPEFAKFVDTAITDVETKSETPHLPGNKERTSFVNIHGDVLCGKDGASCQDTSSA